MQSFRDREQCVHQRETPEKPQGQHALWRGHEDVDNVVSAGGRDDDGQVDRRGRGVGVLLTDVVWWRRVGAVPPDFTNGAEQVIQNETRN